MDTLVCFICHFIDENVIERYNIIKNGLLDGYDIKFVIPTTIENVNFDDFNENIDYICLNLNDKYVVKNHKNHRHFRNEYVYGSIYNMFDNYNNYYYIEYDVIFGKNTSENWNKLFKKYDNNSIDLLCCHFSNYDIRYSSSYNYIPSKMRNMSTSADGKLINDNIIISDNELTKNIHFGFFPFCKLSNKLSKLVYEYYFIKYPQTFVFFEYGIPSIAMKYNCNVVDFDNEYTQTMNDCNLLNGGSMSWYCEDKTIYDRNKLIHPVKEKMDVLNSINIWQVYHDINLKKEIKENKYPFFKGYYTKSNLNCHNINHIQDYINEFVCQYYVYKNNIKSDIVGFCQYGKYFSDLSYFKYGGEVHELNNNIFEIKDLTNTCIGLSTYNNNTFPNKLFEEKTR